MELYLDSKSGSLVVWVVLGKDLVYFVATDNLLKTVKGGNLLLKTLSKYILH